MEKINLKDKMILVKITKIKNLKMRLTNDTKTSVSTSNTKQR